MTLLAIDTSTQRGSVSLLETPPDPTRASAESTLLFEEHFLADRSHSASLFAALEKARTRARGIDQVAVGLGPGSYAGIRIAIGAALGFELGLGSTLLGLPSVAALETDSVEYLAIGDARRDTFYFTRVRAGLCVEGPLLATETELGTRLESLPNLPVFACEVLPAFPKATVALPCARRLAQLAARNTGIVQRGNLEPIYLREAYITLPKNQPVQPDFLR
jgi:tRNA threonylcarbamoyl adenosine modification protein YeaZ